MSTRIRIILLVVVIGYGLWLSSCAPAVTPAPIINTSIVESTVVSDQKIQATASAALALPTPTLPSTTAAEVGQPSPVEIGTSTPGPLPTSAPPSTAFPLAPSLTPESRQVHIEWPRTIRLGESDVVRLTLVPAESGYLIVTEMPGHEVITQTVTVRPLSGYELFAVARLDGVSFDISPSGDQTQYLQPAEKLEWRWSISPQDAGNHRLSLALRLRWIPLAGQPGQTREVAVYAAGLDVRVLSLLGLTRPQAFLGGLVSLLFGGGLSVFALVARPRRPPARSILRQQTPNTNLAIESPSGLEITPPERILLQSLFYRYDRLVIKQEFLSGYSGARTFLVLPIQPDGRADAYTIAKIGEKRSMQREFTNYEQFVKDTLPPITARIQRPPVVSPHAHRRDSPGVRIDLAALQYTFIGEPGLTPTSLQQVLQNDPQPGWLQKLLDVFGPNWWLQRRPYTFRLAQEYDRTLPTHLVIEPFAGSGLKLDGSTPPGEIHLSKGDPVTLRGFPTVELRSDNRSLSLLGGGSPGAPALRVRWLGLGRVEGVTGRVVATRQTLLRKLIGGCELFGLSDPLDALPSLLEETISGSRSTIHGDLNLENILVGPGEMLWLIDFAQTREGHTLFDFAHLEAEIIAHLLAPHIQTRSAFIEMLANPSASPYARFYQLCTELHGMAFRCLANPSQPREYWLALSLSCLGALKFTNLDQHARDLLYLTAAFHLTENIKPHT
jgi:hypothetical protein